MIYVLKWYLWVNRPDKTLIQNSRIQIFPYIIYICAFVYFVDIQQYFTCTWGIKRALSELWFSLLRTHIFHKRIVVKCTTSILNFSRHQKWKKERRLQSNYLSNTIKWKYVLDFLPYARNAVHVYQIQWERKSFHFL